jgi:hypothetical protein
MQQWIAGRLGQVQETDTEVRLGAENYSRTWLFTHYPEGAACLARLDNLLAFHASDPEGHQVQVRIAYHAVPSQLPDDWKTRFLRNRQRGMVASTAETGTTDGATRLALDGYEQISQAVQFHHDAVMELWITVTVTAPSVAILDRLGARLQRELKNAFLAATPLFKEQLPGLKMSHILGPRPDALMKAWPGHMSHVGALSFLTPFLHGFISEGHGCYAGHEINRLGFRRAAHLDFTRGTGAMNWLIIGQAGQGKSTLVKALNHALILEGFTIVQFDANNEYEDQCQALGGITVDVTGPTGNYFDPLVLSPQVGKAEFDDGRYHRCCDAFKAMIRGLVDVTDPEFSLADRLLVQTWKAAGVDADRPETWAGKRASIHDWYALLKAQKGAVAESLRGKLEPHFEGSQRLFKRELHPDWGDCRFIRILISHKVSNETADERAASVQSMLVTHRVWEWVVANKLRGQSYAMINIDEGQRVLRDPDFAKYVYKAVTDGRKLNTGVSIAANDVSVFFEVAGGQGIWNNATLRACFYMEEGALSQARQYAAIPSAVLETIRGLADTHRYVMNRSGRRDWTLAQLELPAEELNLMKTRGLGFAGGNAS